MRAKTKIYHIECFRCSACERQLIPGDEFALREDGLFCKEDHEVLEKATNGENNNNNTNISNNNSNSLHHNEGSNSGKFINLFFIQLALSVYLSVHYNLFIYKEK